MRTFSHQLRVLLFSISLLCTVSLSTFAQGGNPCDASTSYLYWTGETDNDFFNENNWRVGVEDNAGGSCDVSSPLLYKICPSAPDLVNNPHPDANTLEPGAPINFNLYISSATVAASGDIVFACAQKGLTLVGSKLTITNGTVTQGVLSLNNESTVYLQEGAMSSSLSLNFLDAASWVYIKQDTPLGLQARLSNIFVNDVVGVLDNNFRVNNYYQTGSVVRPLSASFAPATIYSNSNLQGSSAGVNEDIIYKGSAVPNGMNNNIGSFKLKRGFMATLAINDNGTGKSRVYIASETDLTVNTLDVALQGNVSFIRVVPWNWVAKKGTGFYYDLNAGWYYNWNLNGNPYPNTEYVPMAWGASGTFPSALSQMIAKKKTTQVLGFNESDNCNDQSGQFNNLCQPAVAVAYYENLMSLGVRLGSPAPREEGPTGWLRDFNTIAKAKDVRFDFVAVHWYDWASNPASTPNATAEQIFNRFKAYLQNVYNIYQLPIWITEFNANPNRPNATQEAFLNLALPYLESLDYVERYAYFQPVSNTGNYYDAGGNLTNIGTLYKNHTSTASITALTKICANNLDGLNQPYTPPTVNTAAFEAECGKYIGNQWVVTNDAAASNGMFIKGDATLAGATTIAKQIHFEFETSTAGSYRVYIRSASTGTGAIKMGMDGAVPEQLSPFTSTAFTWFQIPRFYDLGTGLHRLTVEFPNSNIKLDQIVITNGQENLDAYMKPEGYCTPSNVKFGLDLTDVLTFYEAENAVHGINWSVQTSTNTGAGAYLKSADNITSAQPPTGTDHQMTFAINVAKADEYELWAKIKAINAGENSLWIAVDDEPYRKWDRLGSTTFEWYWKKFHYSYGTQDRSFTYFLAAGQHTVKIAIAGGNVQVDRLAVATKGKNPETTDPNVLLLTENLEFEAETATFLGTIIQQNCVNSSNGIQVNMGTATANGVRFSNIVAATPGAYKLKVSYMSKDSRSFKVIVNGTTLGRQITVSSGNWCFIDASNPTLGSPAIHEVIVNLNRGINTIDIKPWGAGTPLPNSPFIDKIKLEKAPLTDVTLEAELAEFVGTTSITACNTASNTALANLPLGTANGIRYNNLLCSEAKTYDVDVSYISKVARNLRISVNGGAYVTYSFGPSGNWCFEGGSPIIKTIPLALIQGVNTIEMRATAADAPFLDKILIREQPISNVTFTTSGLPAGATSVNVNHQYYTNPTTLSAPLVLATDFTAPVATNKQIYFSYPSTFIVPGGNVYSLTGVTASGGDISASSQQGYNNQFVPTQPRTITGAYELTCAVPSITTQPVDREKTYGDTARFAFVAEGTTVSYQWQINTGSGFSDITASANNPGDIYTGYNTAQLDIASLTVSMSGYQYRCIVTNSCGTITSNTVSLTVNPVAATITANNKSKTYGDDNPAFDAVVGGTINGDVLNYTLTTTAEKFSPVGNYPIIVSLGSNSNYTIAVNNGSLSIETRNAAITANNKSKTYGDDNPTLDAVVSGTVNGDMLDYSVSTTAQKFSGVGNYPITVTLGSNPNYTIAATNGSLLVEKRTITVTASSNHSKVYDGTTDASVTTDAANTIANVKLSDNRVNNDVLSINYGSAYFDFKTVGTNHVITVSGLNITGAGADNYEFSQTQVSTGNDAVITPKDLTVSATGVDKDFDGNTTATVTLSTDKVAGDDVLASFSSANFADFNEGTWQVSVEGIAISGNDAGNYTLLNSSASTNATINKAGTTTTLITSAATVQYMDPLTMTAKIKPANTAQALTGTVQFSIGGVNYGSPVTVVPVPGDAEGMVQATMMPQVSNLPSANPYSVTAVFASTNTNYGGSNQSKSVTVLQRNASPYNEFVGFYTGTLFAWTSGPNSTTASVTLSTTIKDNNAPRGDMRGARVTFYLVNGSSLTPINGAQNLPVGLIDVNDGSIGTASAIVNFNIGTNNAQNFLIAVGVSGAYTNNPNSSLAQTIVTVSKPVPGGYMVGGGRIENISSSGYIKGKTGLNTDFQADISYTKSGTNPKGKANVLVRSYYKTDGTLDTELHTYIIATTAISSLNVGAPTATATFTAKANLYEQMPDLSLVQIEGGSTFEMVVYQNACDQKVAITLYRKAGGIWYSSKWNGTATVKQSLNGGEVAVAGGGVCSSTPLRANKAVENIELLPVINFAIKAYPNPSSSYFIIKIESSDTKKPINVRVLSIDGKIIELRKDVTAGQTIEIGNGYYPGTYIVEVMQGERKTTMKLIKQ
ncbi:T9SS type A sorting domain-containing protein [Lacibacter luteus]|uniref:T9SS type A sorting domain-containing protein n=1 Tax=Lacibacter luteus TaxID=2508719 RepID=A0A4Q1CLK7_9BACT|nr:glycosyl hydrolase [Lacibacter luteus]RXK61634.1 T9SS type A sorting domain-containing protein [Lacibacter luteus]